MTVEQLQEIIKALSHENPHSDGAAETLRYELRERGLDERFWYPIWLASDWMNDLMEWAEDPDESLAKHDPAFLKEEVDHD